MKPNIYIYGNDARQCFIGRYLLEQGCRVIFSDSAPFTLNICQSCTEPEEDDHEILILPVPAGREYINALVPFIHNGTVLISGKLPDDVTELCSRLGVRHFNYMSVPQIAKINSDITAEGAIYEAMTTANISINKSRCLVIGYGSCGRPLADKLYRMGATVDIITLFDDDKSAADTLSFNHVTTSWSSLELSSYDFIFNTAPAMVLNKPKIDRMKNDVVIIDIATGGGTDFKYCEKRQIAARLCPGIPARYAPKTIAKLISTHIMKYIENEVTV